MASQPVFPKENQSPLFLRLLFSLFLSTTYSILCFLLFLLLLLFSCIWLFAIPGTVALHHTLYHYRICSNSCPLSQWCYLTISSSVSPFCSRLQSLPASGSFSMSQLLASGGQSIGALTSASVFPMNIQDWVPLELNGLISLKTKGLSRVFSSTTIQKHQFFSIPPSLRSTLTSVHDYWKNHSFDYMNPCWQTDSLLFNTLYRFVIAFLPRSKCLLIPPSTVILGPRK